MMRLGILGASEKFVSNSTRRLMEEAKKHFSQIDLIPLTDVKLIIQHGLSATWQKKEISSYSYLLPRIDALRAMVGYPVLRFLDHTDVRKPYRAETILVAHNKFLTLEVLANSNIHVPDTFLAGSKRSAKELVKKMKTPLIIKLLSGFGGQGVMILDSKEAAESTIDTMKTLRQDIVIEEFIHNPGEDIRGLVAGDEVIASFKRVAAEGEKRANIKAGGKGIPFKLTDEMEDICIRSARAVGADICAIDMLAGKSGVSVIEVNINPGLEGLEKATNQNIAGRIIDFIHSEAKR